MVSPTFVLTAYAKKDEVTRRNVNFRQTSLRYFVVLIAILVVFGCEYCFDNPSALQTEIQDNYNEDHAQHMTQPQFNLLYSLYAFPNAVVPLLGGMMIDTKGPRIVLILTAAICVAGQVIFGLGGFKNIWSVMLVGRIIFGIGGEVLHAAQNTIISRWFKASELSIVLGICISFPKMGSSLNSIISTKVSASYEDDDTDQKYFNVGVPLLIGLVFMIVSFLMALLLSFFDKKTQKLERVKHESQILASETSGPKGKNILNRLYGSQISMSNKSLFDAGGEEEGQHFSINAIKKLPITYWLLLFVAMLSEALFIPFLDNGNKYFQMVYKQIQTSQDAGEYLILPYIVSSLMVVPLGFLADKVKNRGYLLIGSTGFIWLTYSFMYYVETNKDMRDSTFVPWIPVFLLGVCVAIFCAIVVPTVPMICPPSLLGSGFGMMEMLQNLALGAFPLLAGVIRQTQKDHDHQLLGELKGFHLQTQFFYLLSCLCVIFAVFLETADRFRGNKLKIKDFRKSYIQNVMGQTPY